LGPEEKKKGLAFDLGGGKKKKQGQRAKRGKAFSFPVREGRKSGDVALFKEKKKRKGDAIGKKKKKKKKREFPSWKKKKGNLQQQPEGKGRGRNGKPCAPDAGGRSPFVTTCLGGKSC